MTTDAVFDTGLANGGAALLSAAVTTAAVCLTVTRGRGTASRLFAATGGVTVAWSLALVVVSFAARPYATPAFLLAWVLQWAALIGWLVFLSEYAGEGRWRRRPIAATLGGVFCLAATAILTTPATQLVFADLRVSSAGGVSYAHGPVYPVTWVVASVLLAAVILLLARLALRSRRESRRQSLLLAGAVVTPIVLSALRGVNVFGPGWLTYLTVGNAFQMGLVAVGLYGGGLLRLSPVTRASIIAALSDPILVVSNDTVVDYNESAARVFPDVESGASLSAVSPPLVTADDGPLAERLADRVEPVVDGEERSMVVSRSTVDDTTTVVSLRDVTAAESYAADLERQTEQLDRFASVVSHDLRNPLAVIRGNLEVARRGTDDEELNERIAAAERATDRMTQIVEDALTLAREGEVVEETQPVAVSDVARDAWRTADTGDATLATPTDRVVAADAGRLRSAFENLFRNAVEHGTEDGEGTGLTVTVHSTPAGFAVADDGDGVDPGDRDTVFEEGYTTGENGTGLGLSIVRSVARAHGAEVRLVESDDGGARFEFSGFRIVEDRSRPSVAAE